MGPLGLYVIFYIIFIFLTKDKLNKCVFLCTLCLFLTSSLASIYVHRFYYQSYPIYWHAAIYHCIMLYMLLYPLQRFDRLKGYRLPKSNERLVTTFAVIIVSLLLVKILYDASRVSLETLLTDVHSLRHNLSDQTNIESNPFIRYFNFFAGQYWGVALALAFYFMQHYPQKRLLIYLLLLSSLEVVISGLVVAAREYLIKYIYLFFILYFWFSTTISLKWKKKMRTAFIILGALFISVFVLITVLRFSGSTTFGSPMASVLSYLGQSNIFFSSFFEEFPHGATGGAMRFPIFAGTSMSTFNVNDNIYSNIQLNSFATTIGSWYFEVGYIWTIIITLIHYLVFSHVGKCRITVFKLIYIVWIYDFIFSCMFFYNEVLNKSRILSILFIVFFDFISSVKMNKYRYN